MTAQEKLQILQKVLKEKAPVSSVCRQNGISRKTFYSWQKKYLTAGPRRKSVSLERGHLRGLQHPRGKKLLFKQEVLKIVVANPRYGSHKISQILLSREKNLGNHGVYALLKELGLERKEQRKEFSNLHQVLRRVRDRFAPGPRRLLNQTRKEMVEEILVGGEGVGEVAKKFKVSRKTVWKWVCRYREAQEREKVLLLALTDQHPCGWVHPRGTPEWLEKKILNLVARHPECSTHTLVKFLAGQISNHGIQNVLSRNDLNTYQKRLVFAQSQTTISVLSPSTWLNRLKLVWETFIPQLAPAPPPQVRQQTKIFLASFLTAFLFFTLLFPWLRMLSQVPFTSQIGLLFATLSLFIGTFFFLYSLKYYFTLTLVLGFSRQVSGNGERGSRVQGLGSREENSKPYTLVPNPSKLSWWRRVFGPSTALGIKGNGGENGGDGGNGQRLYAGGLQPDLSHVKLTRQPFVSVHLPLYNERRVVDRLLTASTSLDYENYEVIVVDDSTDETTEILQNWKKHPRVKVIHRDSREGFKGGALKVALEHTDPKAEFILVFDADFIPYPDTITQFLKYFQSVAGSLDFRNQALGTRVQGLGRKDKNSSAYTLVPKPSPIAAIQGYQWHVLNKSENWVTRGVRSEYAGSYVVERSGGEILGSLKQIAGSVYMIRRDVLERYGWGTSITEDFELTLKLYQDGWKVVYTPYVQAPSECVSTLKRLIRQRMRWAEGHTHNVRKMALKMFSSPKLTLREKLEFLYLSPYYLQAAFFLLGTFAWFLAEAVFRTRLPFWTSLWGWSLVFTNLLSLPLLNTVGLFLEEAEEKDYLGIPSFIALSYLLAPFQAYAAVKGFLEKQEGPWFRTPKTGKITDVFTPGRFYRFIWGIFGRPSPFGQAQGYGAASRPTFAPAGASMGKPAFAPAAQILGTSPLNPNAYTLNPNPYLSLSTANNRFNSFRIRPRHLRGISNLILVILLSLTTILFSLTPLISGTLGNSNLFPKSEVYAQEITTPIDLRIPGSQVDFIFHQEPRVRVKLGEKEIEFETKKLGSKRAKPKKSVVEGQKVTYEEIFPGVDLIYEVSRVSVSEKFILKKPAGKTQNRAVAIEEIEQRFTPKEVEPRGELAFFDREGENIFSFEKPLMYEKDHPEVKSFEIKIVLEKGALGFKLKKEISAEGQKWLLDPKRVYPVIIDPTVVINTSSTTVATGNSTQRKIVRTSEGTLHSFVQIGTQTATCGGLSKSGLLWFYSTDSGSTWTCGGQLSSDTTNLMYADARVDSSDNIYVVYSVATSGRNNAYDVFYQKLTSANCSPAPCDWTLETAQTVLDGSGTGTAYHYAVLELEGTTRIWLATRYYDGTNYGVTVYYSNGLTASPTWTQSVASLNTAGNSSSYHYPTIVRFGTNIGVIYTSQSGGNTQWRWRQDADSLTSWVAESTANSSLPTNPSFAAVGDTLGNVYLAINTTVSVTFSYYNGLVWSSSATVSSAALSNLFVSVSTDGTNAWVFYGETTGLSGFLSGNRKLVYKKGVPPFTASEFDASSTAVVSYHATFDKYWSYVSSAYTDDTLDAGNTTTADTQMVTGVGDIIYFGKTEKFDALSWALSTNGAGGVVAWEYCSAVDATPACTAWSSLSFTASALTNFTGNGWGAFTAPSDWQAAKVNSEGTAYYYVSARVTTVYTTSPVGIQMAAIPQINWAGVTGTVASNAIHGIWTENAAGPTKVRYISVSVTASTAPSSTAEISPKVMAYSSQTTATHPSTMRHVVRTSEGTLHAFVQAGTIQVNGCSYSNGLLWLNSTDSGSTWTCQGQLSSDTTNLMYADARVDSSDNIYVVYSVATSGRNNAYDVFYRKLTSANCSPAPCDWTLESAQTVLDGSATGTAYHYAVLELEGTTRIWLATRYYDGTNYGVTVYYSNGLTASPTWTQSVATLDTAGTNSGYHFPTIVRFGSNIGVIYNDQPTFGDLKWRYRQDSDGLTSWVAESTVNDLVGLTTATFATVGDTSGNVYLAINGSSLVYFNYYNGSSWSSSATVSSAAASSAFVSLTTDGTNVWVVYGQTTGLSLGLSGSRKLVYKKGVSPFATGNFDTNSTVVVSQHGTFDKYWSYVSSAYTNDTTDAGDSDSTNTASSGVGNDVQMVTGVTGGGDIAYFGKTAKFDAISWDVSTLGVGGVVAWEYWNGTTWMVLTDFLAISYQNFTGDGYITFIPHTDWATTTVNAEGTPYYYVRAKVTTAYTTSPVGVQMAAIPKIDWASTVSFDSSGNVYTIWTENAASVARVRFATVPENLWWLFSALPFLRVVFRKLRRKDVS